LTEGAEKALVANLTPTAERGAAQAGVAAELLLGLVHVEERSA
jgi:hypothetical protein